MVHEQIRNFFNGFRRDAHPMAIMCGVVGALSAFYHDSLDINNPEHRKSPRHRLIAKMPTIAAMCYKYAHGPAVHVPAQRPGLRRELPAHDVRQPHAKSPEVNPTWPKPWIVIFMLHADHEQNASTSTVRLAGSSGANPFACIAAGIAALWGPAHGGANEAVLNMLDEIGDESNIDSSSPRPRTRTIHSV